MEALQSTALYSPHINFLQNPQKHDTDGENHVPNDYFDKNHLKQHNFDENRRYTENMERYSEKLDQFSENIESYVERSASPVSLDDNDSNNSFVVDLAEKATNLAGKSFTIAAILGLTNSEEDVMNLSVQERIEVNQRHLHDYLYANHHDISKFNSSAFCRSVVDLNSGLRRDSQRNEVRQPPPQMKTVRSHPIPCSNSSGRNKRIRTIFTPEQLERLEAEFERQQYMVGPERLYLAHALQLTEAQVKVWFQNRRIKWRKHHLEATQQRLAVLQRHRVEEDV